HLRATGEQRNGCEDGGFHRLADAFAAERIGAAGGLAGDDQTGARIARAFERAAQRRTLQRADPDARIEQLARRRIDANEVVENLAQVDLALGELAVALRIVAVGDAHTDIEHAVAAGEDPAVAGADRAVPDDL